MSRATYVKHLEHDLEASKRAIDELTQENHQLREYLKTVTTQKSTHESRSNQQNLQC
jgi:hypothetical protein